MHLDWIKDSAPLPPGSESWPELPPLGFPCSPNGYCRFVWGDMGPWQPVLMLEIALVPLLPPHQE